MDDVVYLSHDAVREQGRSAALAGRPIYANPHLGGDAELWFQGWRDVPEEQRGSQPAPASRRIARKKRRGGFSKVHLRGSTPFAEAIHAEVAEAEARTPKPWAIDGVGL